MSGLARLFLFLRGFANFRLRLAGNREGFLERRAHLFETRVVHYMQSFAATLLKIDNGGIGIVCHKAYPLAVSWSCQLSTASDFDVNQQALAGQIFEIWPACLFSHRASSRPILPALGIVALIALAPITNLRQGFVHLFTFRSRLDRPFRRYNVLLCSHYWKPGNEHDRLAWPDSCSRPVVKVRHTE